MKIPTEKLLAAIEADSYLGFCLHCGAEVYGVEPDAKEYECDVCKKCECLRCRENLLI